VLLLQLERVFYVLTMLTSDAKIHKGVRRVMLLDFLTAVYAFNFGMALTGAMWRGYDICYPLSTGFWGVLTIVMGFFT